MKKKKVIKKRKRVVMGKKPKYLNVNGKKGKFLEIPSANVKSGQGVGIHNV